MQAMAQTAEGQAELAAMTRTAVSAMPSAQSVEEVAALQTIIRYAGPLSGAGGR